jgi:hypothetical protein
MSKNAPIEEVSEFFGSNREDVFGFCTLEKGIFSRISSHS